MTKRESYINWLTKAKENEHGEIILSGQAVKDIVELLQESLWIPCSERLPEEAGDYLCTCTDARRLLVTLIKWQPKMKSWNLSGARAYWKIIAWMPKPSPYPSESEG